MVKVSLARLKLAQSFRERRSEHRARQPDIAEAYAQLANALESPTKLTLWPEAAPRRCSLSVVDLLARYIDPLPLLQKALVAMGCKPALSENFIDWVTQQTAMSELANQGKHESPGFYYEGFSGHLLLAVEALERLDWGVGTTEEANTILPAATSATRSVIRVIRAIANLDRACRRKGQQSLAPQESDIGVCSVCHEQVYRPGGKTCLAHYRDKDAPTPEAYQAAYRRMAAIRKHRGPGEHSLVRAQLLKSFCIDPAVEKTTADALPWKIWIAQLDAAIAADMPHLYKKVGSIRQINSLQGFADWLKAVDSGRQSRRLLLEWQEGQPDGIGNAKYITRLFTMAERSLALDAAHQAAVQRQQQCRALIDAGMSYTEIATTLHISRQAVQQLARKMGKTPRAPGRPKKNASNRTPVHC